MHRILLGALTLIALVGCSTAVPTAAPLMATEASAAGAPTAQAQAAPGAPASSPAATAQPRTAAKPVVGEYGANVPPVLLSSGHSTLCSVNVGDELPAIDLPKLGGGNAALESLAGKQATVVLFWTPDRWMAHTALTDLMKDVASNPELKEVAVVGIAVGNQSDAVKAEIDKAHSQFTQLIDADGTALAHCGSARLPRIYVLDSQRKVAWFDIEYSEATRRELHDTLVALAGPKQ